MIGGHKFRGRICLRFSLSLIETGVSEDFEDFEDYLNHIAFYLSVGEQAPFSSVEEVYKLTAKRRNFFVKKLSDLYEQQQEELNKSKKR